MLSEIFKAMLITSLAGSLLAALITLLKPVTKRIFGFSWHYYIWLAVLFVMVLPVKFTLPQNDLTVPAANTQTVQTDQITAQTDISDAEHNMNAENTITTAQKATDFINSVNVNRMNYLSVIWLLGIIVLLTVNIIGYIRLIMKIHKNSAVIPCPEASNYTDRKITVRSGKALSSPFMLGVFRPTLVLPDKELSPQQFNNILRHEMTHFRRKDILYKWFTLFVRCVHWFNPIVYYVAHEINNECEISCDLSVVSRMNGDEQMSYINTILSLVSSDRVKRVPLTTQMASGKRVLKRRFTMIKNVKKTSKLMSVISAVIAFVMLSTTVFASGVLSGLSTDDYTVEITNNGEKIELINKPFIEDGEVYVPLRETMEKAGFNQSNSNIVWDNGQIYITITQNGTAGLYGIELGQAYMKLQHIQPSEIYNTSFNTTEIVMSIGMHNVPILRNSNTYIPIKDINYMLYSFFNVRNEDNSLHELSCNVYDKNGNNITTSLDNDSNKLREYEKQKLPYGTAELLFRDFHRQDFENMKTYCTENCVNSFFEKTLDGYQVFGMKNASIRSMAYANGSSETSDKVFLDISLYRIDFEETSVYAQNRSPVSFYLILQRQSDGRYLIDEFATGL